MDPFQTGVEKPVISFDLLCKSNDWFLRKWQYQPEIGQPGLFTVNFEQIILTFDILLPVKKSNFWIAK